MEIRGRLAPTPSGYLHVGNVFNFLLTYLIVRKQKGKLFLRIDDIDRARVREVYVQDIFETLDWLGLEYDIGPSDVCGAFTYIKQSEATELYVAVCQKLTEQGEVYGCAQSRKSILAKSEDGQYPVTLREQALPLEADGIAWRMKIPNPCPIVWEDKWAGKQYVDLFRDMRDFVIKRKDGIPAYQVASLVDDLRLGINIWVRGEDLVTSTAAQLYLAKQLHWNSFTHISLYHHSLITDAAGAKLAKSTGALSCRYFREQGFPKAAVYARFLDWLPDHFLPSTFKKKAKLDNLLDLLAVFQVS